MPELGTIALITAAALIMLMITFYGAQILRLTTIRRTQREQAARIEAYLHDANRPYDWSVDGI